MQEPPVPMVVMVQVTATNVCRTHTDAVVSRSKNVSPQVVVIDGSRLKHVQRVVVTTIVAAVWERRHTNTVPKHAQARTCTLVTMATGQPYSVPMVVTKVLVTSVRRDQDNAWVIFLTYVRPLHLVISGFRLLVPTDVMAQATVTLVYPTPSAAITAIVKLVPLRAPVIIGTQVRSVPTVVTEMATVTPVYRTRLVALVTTSKLALLQAQDTSGLTVAIVHMAATTTIVTNVCPTAVVALVATPIFVLQALLVTSGSLHLVPTVVPMATVVSVRLVNASVLVRLLTFVSQLVLGIIGAQALVHMVVTTVTVTSVLQALASVWAKALTPVF